MDISFLARLDEAKTLLVALIAVFHLLYFKKASSVAVVAYVFLVLQALSITITPIITGWISPVSVEAGRLVFYFTFAFMYLVGLVAIAKAHRQYSLQVGACAKFTSYAMAVLAVFFVVRHFDRSIGFDVLLSVHRYLVPVVDISIIILMTVETVQLVRRTNGMNGLKGV